ncbi:MAG TPA: phosphatidylserine decarboxylase, partial [Chlamydiales bacterium]|nr:phosphatidylserine decarboxylase [Chlamydiales bacterium]
HSTINIEGTQRSVSTIALRYRPAILAQNDRKIMMVQHEDGTLAIHTFIGATGVNQVRVTAVAQETLQSSGLDYGSMGFGSEDKSVGWLRKKPEGWHKGLIDRIKNFFFGKSNIPVASKTSSEQSSSIHLTPDRVKNIGDEAGTFAMGGSTVVSLYFKKDFVPTGQLSEWNQRANFTSTTARVNNHVQGAPVPPHIRQLEVRCNFGDPVAIPVGHAALKLFQDVLKKGFTHLIGRGATVNDLIARFIERAPESHLAPHEEALKKTYLAIFQKMEKSEPLSRYEEGVYTRLLEALQHQIRKHRVRRS